MFPQTISKHLKPLVSAAMLITLAPVGTAPMAFAAIATNTIDAQAVIAANGRRLIVSGPIQCTAGERVSIRVTVTQRSTGAIAEGSVVGVCTGNIDRWEVQATTRGKEAFQEGAATAVAIATTTTGGQTTDAHQWLVNMTLATP